MEREWIIASPRADRDAFAAQLGVDPIIAQVLHNRGIADIDRAKAFLDPKLADIADPSAYHDLDRAARQVADAVRQHRNIVVYSDYDVDGVCGAAILYHVLSKACDTLKVYIPHRVEEGYGLNVEAIDRLAAEGAQLIITVDCGIRDHDIVAHARTQNLEIIVTDHHEPANTWPDAHAVIHPMRRDHKSSPTMSAADTHAATVNPCGAAVAFSLAWAVAKELSGGVRVDDRFRSILVELTALVALATVADVVPLLGDNRILTRFGMQQMSQTKLTGLKALLKLGKVDNVTVETYHLAFLLGPRLNAAGRMGHADEAFKLMTCDDPAEADKLAAALDKQNKARQKLEEKIFNQAIELASQQGQDHPDHPILVLAREEWHVGVIGIVASKLVERFRRPVIMIAVDGDFAQGSARSVEGYDINQAIESCAKHLIGYGGHAMAAGLRLSPTNLPALIADLTQHARTHMSDVDTRPALHLDAEPRPETITSNFVWQLSKLEPFGQANHRPIFATPVVDLIGYPKTVGNGGQHLSFAVKWGDRTFRAIAFNQADQCNALLDARACRLAFEPVLDTYTGGHAVQLRVKEIKAVRQ